ncbi:MAG: hypothetical protein MJ090_04415 [Clostridia bacterium]|nr:hypothetical protein [Clostridia bacterium]
MIIEKIKTVLYYIIPSMNHWPLTFVALKAMRSYKKRNGYTFDIYHPKSFAEKILTYTVLYDNSKNSKAVDKYEFKSYIKEKLGKDGYTIPAYKVWNNIDEVKRDWDDLPNEFFIKSTISCSGANMFAVKDKASLDKEKAFSEINKWFKPRNTRLNSYNRVYWSAKPRVIAEKFMSDFDKDDLQDYKFYCFNGEPLLLHTTTRDFENFNYPRTFFDMDWNKIDVSLIDHPTADSVPKPKHFEEMKELARTLSKDLVFARIDLYEGEEHPLVGEVTLGDPACPIKPLSFDRELGDKFDLPLEKLDKCLLWKK